MATTRTEMVKLARLQAYNHGYYIWGGSGAKDANYALNNRSWVASMESTSDAPTNNTNRVIAFCQDLKNKGYDLSKSRGFDCSGLIGGCWNYLNGNGWKRITDSSGFGSSSYSTQISRDQLVGGDFLWRKGHIGLYIGNNRVVHARGRSIGVGVVEQTLAASGSWSKYCRAKNMFYNGSLAFDYDKTDPNYVEKKTITLTFDPTCRLDNGTTIAGTVSPSSKQFLEGSNMGTLPVPTCSNPNYTFAYWYVVENGTRYRWFDNTSCGNQSRTLYAQYNYNDPQKYPVITKININSCRGDGGGSFAIGATYTGYTTDATRYCVFDNTNTDRSNWITLPRNQTGNQSWNVSIYNLVPWKTNYKTGVRRMTIHCYNRWNNQDNLVGAYEYQVTQQYTLDFNGGVRADSGEGSITGFNFRTGNTTVNAQNLLAALVNTHDISVGTAINNMLKAGKAQTWLTRKGYEFAGLSTNKTATSGSFDISSSLLNIAASPNALTEDKKTWFVIWKPLVITCEIYSNSTYSYKQATVTATGAEDFKFNYSNASKTGYTFRGYTCPEQKLVIYNGSTLASTLAGRTLKFYPSFTANNYTVYFNYNANEGTVNTNSINVTYDASFATQMANVKATPKKNYTFIGWQDSSGNMVTTFSAYKYARNETFTAVFKYTPPPRYNNYYYDANGNLLSNMTQNGEVGTAFTIPSAYLATPADHRWKGWTYNGSLYQTGASVPIIAQDRKFYATYEAIKFYTVTFKLNGGSYNGSTSDIVVNRIPENTSMGSLYPNINNIKRQNYYFIKFETSAGAAFTANTIVNSNITVSAVWDEALGQMTLHYNDIRDTVKEIPIRVNTTYYTQNSPEFNIPSNIIKTGYESKGWYGDSALSKKVDNFKIVEATDNPHLYLKWEKKQYRILYKCSYGSLYFNQKYVAYEDPYGDFPKVTPSPGYHFDNWYTDNTYTTLAHSAMKMGTSEVTLYGRCIPDEFTLSFDWNCKNPNGIDNPSPLSVKYGQSIPTLPNGVVVGVNVGYTFKGWFDSAGKQLFTNGIYNYPYDITAYAKWEKLPYQIQLYERKNKPFGSAITVLFDDPIPTNLPIPKRDKAIFQYWQDKATGEKFDFDTRMPAYNIALEAVWKFDFRSDVAAIINKVGKRLLMGPRVWNNGRWKIVKIYVHTGGEWVIEKIDPNDFINAN